MSTTYYNKIRNNSHYINETSRCSFRLVNSNCFSAQSARQLSYYVRLYYHYKHVTETLGGRAYFYTLTYNDKALPKFNGVPCFHHSDLDGFMRDSGFDKQLKRKFGYKLQYFVSCELGDGKGSRGFANNPHYHVIFFLIPYKPTNNILSDIDFYNLVCKYWQGTEYKSPKNFKFGISMPGDNYGLINSPHALSYVSKYVLKDITYFSLYKRLKNSCIDYIIIWLQSRPSVIRLYSNYLYYNPLKRGLSPLSNPDIISFVNRLYDNVWKKYVRNQCMPKVRVSQGVGLSGLKSVNHDNLTINIPYKNTYKTVNLPMYLYRKMYYKVVKDDAGNNKYILNDFGLQTKVEHFDKYLKSQFIKNRDIICQSKLLPFLPTEDELFRYTVYDLIYRDRLCPDINLPIEPKIDYSAFLTPDIYTSVYDDINPLLYYNRSYRYESHPYFNSYLKKFAVFDNILENHYICDCNKRCQDYLDIMRTKKHFSIQKFNNYVVSLNT